MIVCLNNIPWYRFMTMITCSNREIIKWKWDSFQSFLFLTSEITNPYITCNYTTILSLCQYWSFSLLSLCAGFYITTIEICYWCQDDCRICWEEIIFLFSVASQGQPNPAEIPKPARIPPAEDARSNELWFLVLTEPPEVRESSNNLRSVFPREVISCLPLQTAL